jgi:SAM-dependent methyltransferase
VVRDLLMGEDDARRRLEERRVWLRRMLPHVRAGTVAELGCGSGFVLEFLAGEFDKSVFVGIDENPDRLECLAQKMLPNVIGINADITGPVFPRRSLDTAIFVASLHEVYSNQGGGKVVDALSVAGDALKASGVVIVQDFLKPPPRAVEIQIKNDEALQKFLRFAGEFRPRRVQYRRSGHTVTCDVADAVEFISKYRSPTEDDWQHEMGETHYFFTEHDFGRAAESAGLRIISSERLVPGRAGLERAKQDIGFTFDADYGWIQVVMVHV